MEWFRPKPNENAVLGVTWCWLNNSLHYFLGLEWTRWPLSFIGCFSGSIKLYATIACYNSEKLHMYSAPSELILNECCSQIACRSGVVVVHAQLHTLYELILWASQCPARVDIGSSGGEGWSGGLVHSFREWKVNWKCLDIKIESERWNEMSQNRDWEWKVNCFFRF